jgi:predicted nuclease of predicted toxin-antitoxin system
LGVNFFVDFNLDGYAVVLLGILIKRGWLDLIDIEFVTFREVGLSKNSSDRVVWDYAQANQMMVLTANRNMKGKDSLEQVMRDSNSLDSFPIVTIGDMSRIDETEYREQCVDRLVEIVINIDNYMGAGRLFIP